MAAPRKRTRADPDSESDSESDGGFDFDFDPHWIAPQSDLLYCAYKSSKERLRMDHIARDMVGRMAAGLEGGDARMAEARRAQIAASLITHCASPADQPCELESKRRGLGWLGTDTEQGNVAPILLSVGQLDSVVTRPVYAMSSFVITHKIGKPLINLDVNTLGCQVMTLGGIDFIPDVKQCTIETVAPAAWLSHAPEDIKAAVHLRAPLELDWHCMLTELPRTKFSVPPSLIPVLGSGGTIRYAPHTVRVAVGWVVLV